ncbi:MAG: mannose-1-phosphate guanylyltransferase [Bacteroidales bacterium]|nr:mannose-1-phosphate guanylyltransferase [Bacteroidales bacterium]
MDNRYCIILAGGSGSRLWPVSKVNLPKQFLEVADTGKTFIQHTFERFCSFIDPGHIFVVTLPRYKNLVREQVPDIPEENILLEPYSRNTAPCIAFSAIKIYKKNPDAVIAVTPSDHIIQDVAAFRANLVSAIDFAAHQDALVTLGVSPTRPDPNYGYIQAAGGRDALKKGEPLKVKTFTEKPNVEIARVFIGSGEFVWNSGIFVWKAKTILDEMAKHLPMLFGWFDGWEEAVDTPAEQDWLRRAYGGCERASIDFGIMEKTDKAWVYPADFDWADVGAWESMYNYASKGLDDQGNVVLSHHKIVEDSKNLMAVCTDKEKLVIIKGLDNYLVVDTDDVLMICPRSDKDIHRLVSDVAMPEYEKFR